jgi:hypothetical protein
VKPTRACQYQQRVWQRTNEAHQEYVLTPETLFEHERILRTDDEYQRKPQRKSWRKAKGIVKCIGKLKNRSVKRPLNKTRLKYRIHAC